MGVIPGIVLASVFPLIFLKIIRARDFYQLGKYNLIVRSLFWGGLVYLPAASVNFILINPVMFNQAVDLNFIAPLHEELLKGLILFYLIRRSKITFSVDGALYGFATGIGFAIAENIEYVTFDKAEAIKTALQRIVSANLVHPSSSAILGIALGMFYLKRTRTRWLFMAVSLPLAVGLHMFYNTVVDQEGAYLVNAAAIGLLGAAFIYLAMQHGKKQAQEWIRQKLGMRDGVTPGEVALVNRLPSEKDLLQPVFERFGPEKTAQVERLLYLQARIGIKRKFLDSIPENNPMRSEVERELREMRTEMLAAERVIGTYTMLFVRGLYTDEMVSVWEQMQARIRNQSATNGDQKGGGLWSSLEERLKSP